MQRDYFFYPVSACSSRLRNSRLLLVGMRGLSAEVAKDVVLAGISALTVMDPHPLGPDDAGNRFLCLKDGENVRV